MTQHSKLLPHVVAARATDSRHAERIYLEEVDGRAVTYQQAHRGALGWAAHLEHLGVGYGDRVATLLPTSGVGVMASIGVSWLGAIDVPINPAHRGRLLRYYLEDAAPRAVVTAAELLAHVEEALVDLPVDALVVPDGDEATTSPVAAVHLGEPAPAAGDEVSFRGPQAHDVAVILYTSGTTGPSKGVLVPWEQLLATCEGSLPPGALGEDDAFYAPFGLFHITGRSAVYTMALHAGRTVLRDRFSTDAYWSDIAKHGCTTTVLMGAMANFLYRLPASDDDARTPLEKILMAPLIPEVEDFKERFGVRVCTVFNMTEVSVPIASNGWELANERSCGCVREGYEVRVVDEFDREVAVGDVGELIVRAGRPWTLASGYWQKPEKTVEAWRNLWFHTGDAMRVDEDGNYYFVDRLKDAIRRRGENISSLELELEVGEHPGVHEAAAFGVPSEYGEEDVMVAVVAKPDHTIDPKELTEFLADRVPKFMVPRYVEVRSELPKTQTEKIKKQELKSEGVTSRTWDRLGTRAS